MKQGKTVTTANIVRLMRALENLSRRTAGGREEGMGILYGDPGEGKTTAISHAINQVRGIYVRANVTLTVSTLLGLLCRELMVAPARSRGKMLEQVAQELALDPRPIVIDEADYLCRPGRQSRDMLDALRDLYDLARIPILLVGLPDDEMVRLLRPAQEGPLARFSRRITERVHFRGLHISDSQKIAGQLCEVSIEGALPEGARAGDVSPEGTLLERLHADAGGNVGRLVVSLGEAERFARANDIGTLTLDDWNARQ